MNLSAGQPPLEGRYVAFVQCESRQVPEWCEPIIATWHGGKWHCDRPVYGWIGPLPVRKVEDFFTGPAEHRIYDL